MKKILYFCKNFISSIKNHLTQVGKGLDELRDRGMGPKS